MFLNLFLLFALSALSDDIKPSNAPTRCPFKPQQIVRPTTTIEVRNLNKTMKMQVSTDKVFIIANKPAPKNHCAIVYGDNILYAEIDNLQIWNPVVSLQNYPSKIAKDCAECGYTTSDIEVLKELCPLEKIKLGQMKWDLKAADLVIANCTLLPARIIPRDNDNNYCPQKAQDLSNTPSWKACPPPRECTISEQQTMDRVAELVLEIDKTRCHKPFTQALQKKLDELRIQIRKITIPECIENFKDKPDKIVVHHSALSPLIGPDGLQKSHVENRGFSDIGYHFVISQTPSGEWKLFEGRNRKYKGAHVGGGLNGDSLGIVIAGNYAESAPSALNPAGDKPLPPPEAVVLLVELVEKIKNEYPIKKIYTHRELKEAGSGCSTECPSTGCTHIKNKINKRYFEK